MSQIMKAFLGVFLVLLMALTAMGILSAYMEVLNAQDMQARFVDEIENSDFNAAVIQECFAQSQAAGYTLSVTLFLEDAAVATAHNAQQVPQTAADMAKVQLEFPFRVSFLGIDQTHTFVSYAK